MEGVNHKKSKVSHKKLYNNLFIPHFTIFVFVCKFKMSFMRFQVRLSIGKTFLIKIYFSLTSIIICQNSHILETSQSSKNTSSEILEGILTVFSYPLFSIIPKMLNVIKLTMIFGIIYHYVLFSIGG